MPHEVIMPALGMAQDTGLLVAWRKAAGDAVKTGDVLFEVETDKSTMEVEAGYDGYLADLRAEAGENVPVGNVIAVITAEKPSATAEPAGVDAPRQASASELTTVAKPTETRKAEASAVPSPLWKPAREANRPIAGGLPSDGRILASPKARRLAAEQGLDLSRLAAQGTTQPFHVRDLEALRSLPAAAAATATVANSIHLLARVPASGLDAFRAWLDAETNGGVTLPAVLAAFGAGAFRAACVDNDAEVTIAVDPHRADRLIYDDPDLVGLRNLRASDRKTPTLLIRDLTATRLTEARLGSDGAPVLTLTRAQDAFSIALEAPAESLTPDAAIDLVTEFAARLDAPIRQLL